MTICLMSATILINKGVSACSSKNIYTFRPITPEPHEERYQERLIKNLKRRAESLGFELVASPITSGFAKG